MFLIGRAAVFIVEAAQEQGHFSILLCKIFRKNSSIRIILGVGQPVSAEKICLLNNPAVSMRVIGIYHVDSVRIVIFAPSRRFFHPVRSRILRSVFRYRKHLLFKTRNGYGRPCYRIIREILIQPDHFLVRNADILCHQSDVIHPEHIRINEPARNPGIPKDRSPIRLCILYAAGSPADSPIKVIDHPK